MSIKVSSLELEGANFNEMSRFPAGMSHKSVVQNCVVQHDANGENRDTETEDDCDEDNWGHGDLHEEQYWEQSEPVKKGHGSKKKYPIECYNGVDDNFITYRKTCSKYQKERQLNKQYKLDTITTVLIEKLVGIKDMGPYHDAIGEGRNSIVIEAGNVTQQVKERSKGSFNYKNAVKIYKLCNNGVTNKAIFQRTKNEFHQMNDQYLLLGYILPYPVCYYKNILVMVRVGTDDEPALPLNRVPSEYYSKLYELIIRHLKALTMAPGLVHGNLSCKSILYWHELPYFVGWAYTMPSNHPNAMKKLMKDCHFVTKFFKKRGVPVKSTEDMFKEVSNLTKISRDVLNVINKSQHSKTRNCSKTDIHKPSGNSRFK